VDIIASCTELEFIRPKQIVIEYGGTLDRQSTGVLPVGLGNSCTEELKKLLHSDKIISVHVFDQMDVY